MVLAAWLALAVSFCFSAALVAYIIRMTVPRARHDAAVRLIEKQQDTIDRLLARNFERMLVDHAERCEKRIAKMVRHRRVQKPD